MTKKEKFINTIQNAFFDVVDINEIDPDIISYWEVFKSKEEKEKPLFTDNGKLILKYLQENKNIDSWKAKDIAEGLFISSRTVSGAIRKLVTDGYVEKIGQEPVVYTLTEYGKTINID